MEKNIILNRIVELRDGITILDRLYESNQETILNGVYISDSDYDKMYMELERLEATDTSFYDENSPTQKMANIVIDGLKKVKHNSPMLSQDKINDFAGVRKFATQSTSSILVEPKFDGLTIVSTYENGRLKEAVTRGNGLIGEEVTHTVATFRNVPKIIPYKGFLETRSEALVPYAEFERINKTNNYSNPRNLASGTVRQLDASIARERNLICKTFDMVSENDFGFKYDTEIIEFLSEQGIETADYLEFENSEQGINDLIRYIAKFESEIRQTLPFMVDGLVLKFNDLSERKRLGNTGKHPRWAVAYKFEASEASTKIVDVIHQVGRTGQITPVAILDTIEIDSVNVSRASLHNYPNIKDKDIRINDNAVIIRANDVIPYVVKSLMELRTGDEILIETPQYCPSCGAVTEFEGEHLFCTGINCKPQLQKKVEHFASRNAMNIGGLGTKTVETFFENNIVESFLDIYHLADKKDIIINLEGYGIKSYNKLIENIEQSKGNSLEQVIYGFGIMNIGGSASKDLAIQYKNIDNIIEASRDVCKFKEELLSIKDFGEKMSQSVIDFFTSEVNLETIRELKELGLTMQIDEDLTVVNTASKVAGMVFVVTGSVFHYENRKALEKEIESLGGKVTGSVSKNTNYVIFNNTDKDNPDRKISSKEEKAISLNIPIITEEEYMELIK